MPTLGELLNHTKSMINIPDGFKIENKTGLDGKKHMCFKGHGYCELTVYSKKKNGDFLHTHFSGHVFYWDDVIKEVKRVVNSTRPLDFHMGLSYKKPIGDMFEEMYHGEVNDNLLQELINLAPKED